MDDGDSWQRSTFKRDCLFRARLPANTNLRYFVASTALSTSPFLSLSLSLSLFHVSLAELTPLYFCPRTRERRDQRVIYRRNNFRGPAGRWGRNGGRGGREAEGRG